MQTFEELDQLATAGHDVRITRLIIQSEWKVDIVFAGTQEERAAVWGTGEDGRIEKAAALAIVELNSNREQYLDDQRRDAYLPTKAALKVKPRLKMV